MENFALAVNGPLAGLPLPIVSGGPPAPYRRYCWLRTCARTRGYNRFEFCYEARRGTRPPPVEAVAAMFQKAGLSPRFIPLATDTAPTRRVRAPWGGTAPPRAMRR